MPFVCNQGVQIYYELEGDGEPLVLQHGYTSSLQRWRECGYVAALSKYFKVILIDARGHGRSHKPHNKKDYDWQLRAADIVAVVDDLEIERFHFWGYSMGGIYGYKLALTIPDRLLSLVIGGAHPYATSFAAFDHIDGRNQNEFIQAIENLLGERFTAEANKRMLANDLIAMVSAAGDRPSLAEGLLVKKLRWLLYTGSNDQRCTQIEQFAGELEAARLILVPSKNHAEMMVCSELIVPEVIEFLRNSS